MGSTIGVPDVSQLPVESDLSKYDLRNAAAALSPAPDAPPGFTPEQSIDELNQRSLASFQNPGQYVPENPQEYSQQQFQQPQFQPPHDLQSALDAHAAVIDQQTQQKKQGVLKHLFTSFLGGAGRAMMVQAGLETPEMQQQRELQNLLAISNAQSHQQLAAIETEKYRMEVAKYPVYGPDGNPILDDQGRPKLYPRHVAQQLQEIAARPLQKLSPQEQTYNAHLAAGESHDEALAAITKQAPGVPHTVNAAEGVLQWEPTTQTWKRIGGSPKSNVNLMTTSDAKDIADAIENGDQPPTLQGLYRNAGPVRAELARRGFPLAQAETDWKAVQRHLSTLNGPQQTRLMQSIVSASDMLEKIAGLYQEWQKLAPTSGFKVLNRAALIASKNVGGRTGAVATSLDAQIADLTADLGNVYMGGNSPTDHALGLAGKNLSSDWNQETFEEALKQARANLKIRQNSIQHSQPVGVSSGSPYIPSSPAAGGGTNYWDQFPVHK